MGIYQKHLCLFYFPWNTISYILSCGKEKVNDFYLPSKATFCKCQKLTPEWNLHLLLFHSARKHSNNQSNVINLLMKEILKSLSLIIQEALNSRILNLLYQIWSQHQDLKQNIDLSWGYLHKVSYQLRQVFITLFMKATAHQYGEIWSV